MLTLALNSVLLFRKLSVCKFILCISETLLCSTSARVEIVLLLDALQLLVLFIETLTCVTRTVLYIIFHASTFLTIKTLIVFNMNVCIYIFLARSCILIVF
jgi:hypothetical protein